MTDDLKHTNEFGEIEAFRDTKYWFKRDLQTIKRSSIATFKISPLIFLTTFVLFLFVSRLVNAQINLGLFLVYALILSPVFLLGYLMFHVIATKGYDIDPYSGTHINTPHHANRFSVNYILSSNISYGRKIMFLFRLVIYVLLVVGLLLNILISFNK